MNLDFGQLGQLTKTFRSSSAAVPGLILAGMFGLPGIFGVLNTEGRVQEIFLWLVIAAFAVPALQIVFLTVFDRDRLQNEKHVENKLLIAKGKPILGDKSGVIEGKSGELVDNPKMGDHSDA